MGEPQKLCILIYNLYICVLLINASQLIYLYYMSANKLDIGIGDDEVVSSDVAKGGGTMHMIGKLALAGWMRGVIIGHY